ncbi:putative developmental regulator, ULTRAPETALA [Helianthus annuus]|nr:putative developmental regulator, ULTRAPETALA [Helianthus annuus]
MWCSHHDLPNKDTQFLIGKEKLRLFFSNEKLSAFVGQIIVTSPHYILIACGCTNNRLGDSVGILRIDDDGTFSATCHCNQNCNRGMIKLLYIPTFFFICIFCYKNLIMVLG